MTLRADLLLRNATIHTMDGGRRTASSLAVLGGRIVAIDEDVDARRTVDLHGLTVLPGFHDAHNHMAGFGMRLGELDLSFPAVRTVDEVYAAVRAAADRAAPGEWIIGGGYDQNKLGAHPTLAELDRLAPNNPVWLKHTSGHMAVVNGHVFAMGDESAVPPGGVIVRDEEGRPTGLLQEQAQALVSDLVRPYSQRAIAAAITAASAQYAAEGLVGVTECGIGGGWVGHSPVEAAAYQACLDAGTLLQRVTLMPVSDAMHDVVRAQDDGEAYGLDLGLRSGFGNDRLRLGAMKVFSDGSLIGRTAAMCCEFEGSPGNVGFLQEDEASLRRKIRGAHRAGWQVAVHAIGDRAVKTVVDIYADVLAEQPRDDHRHRIEHCGVCRPEDLERIAELGIIPVPQGRFIDEIGDGMMEALGPERSEWCYRGQSFLDAGIDVPGSSDRPVVVGAPLLGIQAMVTRRTAGGRVLGARESMSAADAVRCYTYGSAHANFSDDVTGSVGVGKYADLVVLSADPLTVPPEEIGTIEVRATMLEGALTYGEL